VRRAEYSTSATRGRILICSCGRCHAELRASRIRELAAKRAGQLEVVREVAGSLDVDQQEDAAGAHGASRGG
jgi:hypothetical protein